MSPRRLSCTGQGLDIAALEYKSAAVCSSEFGRGIGTIYSKYEDLEFVYGRRRREPRSHKQQDIYICRVRRIDKDGCSIKPSPYRCSLHAAFSLQADGCHLQSDTKDLLGQNERLCREPMCPVNPKPGSTDVTRVQLHVGQLHHFVSTAGKVAVCSA